MELQSQWVEGCRRNNLAPLVRWWRLIVESAYRLYLAEGCEEEWYEGCSHDLRSPEARQRLKVDPFRRSCEEAIGMQDARTNLIEEQQHLCSLLDERSRLRAGDPIRADLEVYGLSNLLGWRQVDLHQFPLQRRMACAMTHAEQAALPPPA